MFIELTETSFLGTQGAVLINVDHVAMVRAHENGAYLWLPGSLDSGTGYDLFVAESYETVLAVLKLKQQAYTLPKEVKA